ncbi:MAG: hypothetical protein QOC66_3674, partial [Pseudonocardiales bacterium]|nr:hypothetical protein [Pseudonocardiales bacterium]
MTDDQMDARLRRAGERWRAEETTIAETTASADAHPADEIWLRPRRPRHVGLLASAALVAAALVAGGAFLLNSTGGKRYTADAPALEGTVWRLVGYDSEPARTNSLSTFYIGDDGRLVADDGCTVIGAHIDTKNARLAPAGLDLRYYDCTDSAGDITFTRAIDILKDRPAYSITGDRLTIKAKRGTVHLAAAPTLLPPTLDVPTFLGSKWQLTDVSDGQGTEHPVVGVPTLHALNGRLTLSDGCNTLSGPIAIEGQQVHLNGLATTEIGCTGVAASTAAAIDKVYGGPEVHEQVEGNRLTVKGDGAGALVYTWAPDDRGA